MLDPRHTPSSLRLTSGRFRREEAGPDDWSPSAQGKSGPGATACTHLALPTAPSDCCPAAAHRDARWGLVGAWVFYVGLAVFALIAGADLVIYLLDVRSRRHRLGGHS